MGKIMKEGIQYGVGGLQEASDISYGTGSVADALDELTSYRIVTGSGTTDSAGSLAVNYGLTFASNPTVMVIADAWTPVAVSVAGIGKTTVTLRSTANTTLHWMAYGIV